MGDLGAWRRAPGAFRPRTPEDIFGQKMTGARIMGVRHG